MNDDKELYKQKFQAQLDEWKADINKLKAKAMESKADAQLEINKLVVELEAKVQVATAKLGELSEASEGALDSVKKGVESARDALKSSVRDARSKFKE